MFGGNTMIISTPGRGIRAPAVLGGRVFTPQYIPGPTFDRERYCSVSAPPEWSLFPHDPPMVPPAVSRPVFGAPTPLQRVTASPPVVTSILSPPLPCFDPDFGSVQPAREYSSNIVYQSDSHIGRESPVVSPERPAKNAQEWANMAILAAHQAIQIASLTASAVAGIGGPGALSLATGVTFAVLAGGSLSLFTVETGQNIIKKIHKVPLPDIGTLPKNSRHFEDLMIILNRLVKGLIQSGALLTGTVAYYLNTTNWVARKVIAPILTGAFVAEFAILVEEISLYALESRSDTFRVPPCADKINTVIRGIIQIIKLSSTAAAAWVSNNEIARVIGYVRTGILTGSIAIFMLEIAMMLLEEYQKKQRENAAEDALPEGMV